MEKQKEEEGNATTIYVVSSHLSSPNHIMGSEAIDDLNQKITYSFSKEIRRKISTCRGKYLGKNSTWYKNTLQFHTLKLCNGSQVESLQQHFADADAEMKSINRILEASVEILPLVTNEIQKGELLEKVIWAIKYRVLSEVIERLDIKSTQLPAASRKAMEKLLERLKQVNLLNDTEINRKLDDIKDRIMNEDLATVRKDLQEEMKNLTTKRALEIKQLKAE